MTTPKQTCPTCNGEGVIENGTRRCPECQDGAVQPKCDCPRCRAHEQFDRANALPTVRPNDAPKHTPGPWQFRTYPAGTTIISTHPDIPGSMVMGRLKGVRVQVEGFVYDDQSNAHELSADAHLIAAAPDLLAALEAFLRAPSIGSSGPGSATIEVQTFNLKAAEAAIAKAKGAL